MSEQLKPAYPQGQAKHLQTAVHESRTPLLIMGIVLMIVGIVAIAYPLTTTIVVKTLLGWVVLIAGITQIIMAFSTGKWSEFFVELLIGILFIFAGGWLAFFPLAGIITLTLILGVTFIIQGGLEVFSALRLRPLLGWGWVLIAGILAVVIGLLVLGWFPTSAVWAIGLLVGINLLASGIAYIGLALTAPRGA